MFSVVLISKRLFATLAVIMLLMGATDFHTALAEVAAGEAGSDASLYIVKDIAVDKTAKTAALAREKALPEARIKAFDTLLKRITLAEERKKLKPLKADKINDFIAEMSITGEKTSSVRYIASLDFTFNPKQVKSYLEENNTSYVAAVSAPMLLFPLLEGKDGGPNLLFEEENEWFAFFNKRRDKNPLAVSVQPLIIPYGDSLDMAETEALAKDLDFDALPEDLRYRYNVSDIIVAVAQENENNFAFSVYHLKQPASEYEGETPAIIPFNFKVSKNANKERIFNAAEKTIREKLETDWKKDNVVRFSEALSLTAIVPIDNIPNWIEVKRRLDTVAIIDRYELKAMKNDRIQLNIFFGRGIERLVSDLASVGLQLTQAPSGIWLLYEKGNKRVIPLLQQQENSQTLQTESSVAPSASQAESDNTAAKAMTNENNSNISWGYNPAIRSITSPSNR